MSSVGLLLCAVLLPQGAGFPPHAPGTLPFGQDASEATATVQGVVTRIGTDEPIPRAAVYLTPVANTAAINSVLKAAAAVVQSARGETDAGGNFIIGEIHRASTACTCTATGSSVRNTASENRRRPALPLN